jgi:hypothetical protein
MNAIDDNVLDMFLRPAEKRQFTQKEKESIQKAESNDRIISPTVVKPVKTASKPVKTASKPVKVLKDNDEDEDLFKELELEFSSGKINMDDFL